VVKLAGALGIDVSALLGEWRKEHGVNQSDPHLASSYEDEAPDGCYAVLR
jgi:hypothetical protein